MSDDGVDIHMRLAAFEHVRRLGESLGDGVNVAARLEGIAEPGGISISSSAYEQVRGKVPVEFTDLGEQNLKNIARPIRAYALVNDGLDAKTKGESTKPKGIPKPLSDRPSIAVLPFQNMSGDPEQEYFADGLAEDIITELSRFREFAVIARNSTFFIRESRSTCRRSPETSTCATCSKAACAKSASVFG
jgi:hypothetical protein